MPVPALRSLVTTVLATWLAPAVAAQCDPQWLPGDAIASLAGSVAASTTWDPDGTGPAAALLIVAGDTLTGGLFAGVGVAAWDGTQWLALGTPPGARAWAVTNFNGTLVAAFETAYAVATISAWNGSTWQTLGTVTGPNSYVRTLAVFQGSLYAGGSFAAANGVPATNVARWDGVVWSAAGSGQPRGVRTMLPFSGALYVASYDPVTFVGYLATWTGTTWANIATCNGQINALAARNTTTIASSFLFAGGSFTQWTGANGTFAAARAVRFSPSANAWTALGSNLTGNLFAMAARSTGLTTYEVVAVQNYSNEGLWQWNNTTWVQQGAVVANPTAVTYYNGAHHLLSLNSAAPAQRLQAGVWTPLAMATTSLVDVRAVLDDGPQIVVGGNFGIRRGQPRAWSEVGGGLTGTVTSLARSPNGDLIAGGFFAIPGGASSLQIARWNGAAWSSLTTNMNGSTRCLLALPNGELVAGGDFTSINGTPLAYVGRWNGTSWQPLGGGMNAPVNAIVRAPNGDLVAGGEFTLAGSLIGTALRVAAWNGSTWSQVGAGLPASVSSLTVPPDGGLVAATTVGFLLSGPTSYGARWDGAYWAPLPITSSSNTVAALPDGDLLFGGDDLVRTSGTNVSPYPADALVRAITIAADGVALVGGPFAIVGGVVGPGLARLAPTCPATAVTAGAGCTGSAGPMVLTATTLPWIGSTLRAVATGLPAIALGVVVTGFSPTTLPLATVLPVALPGCTLHVAPDLLEVAIANAGAVNAQLVVPNSLPLVGLQLHQQVVGLRLDVALNITEVTATNSLRSTVGAL